MIRGSGYFLKKARGSGQMSLFDLEGGDTLQSAQIPLPDAPELIHDEAHDLDEQLTESCAQQWSDRAMKMLFRDLAAAAA